MAEPEAFKRACYNPDKMKLATLSQRLVFKVALANHLFSA